MKIIKQTDVAISLSLIILFVIMGLINGDATFLIGYFVVGGWQVISMIVHTLKGWFTNKNSSRYIYHWVVCCIIITGLTGLIEPFFLALFAYTMLLAAPVMALYYTWICYDETYIKMQQRPLSQLK